MRLYHWNQHVQCMVFPAKPYTSGIQVEVWDAFSVASCMVDVQPVRIHNMYRLRLGADIGLRIRAHMRNTRHVLLFLHERPFLGGA